MTILRPEAVSFDMFARDRIDDDEQIVRVNQWHDDDLDEWIDMMHSDALEIADQKCVPIDVQEWQLTSDTPESAIKNRRMFADSHIIATANPSDRVCAYLAAAIHANPVLRCIVGFERESDLMDSIRLFGSMRSPVFEYANGKLTLRRLPRLFAVARKNRKQLRHVLEQCISFERATTTDGYSQGMVTE